MCVCLYACEYARCVRHVVHVQPRDRQAQAQRGPAHRRCSNRIFIYAWELDRPRLVAFGALPARASCRWLRGGALAAYPYIYSLLRLGLGASWAGGGILFLLKPGGQVVSRWGPELPRRPQQEGIPLFLWPPGTTRGPCIVLARRSSVESPPRGTAHRYRRYTGHP